MMPNKCCGKVLRDACALALGDEPLASGVEDGAVQLRIEAAQVGIPLHSGTHRQGIERAARIQTESWKLASDYG